MESGMKQIQPRVQSHIKKLIEYLMRVCKWRSGPGLRITILDKSETSGRVGKSLVGKYIVSHHNLKMQELIVLL